MFYLYLDGGEGCDDTLACNKLLKPMKAKTWDEARKEAADDEELGDPTADPRRGYGCGEGIMHKATILEVVRSEDVDIKAWAAGRRREIEAEEKSEADARERAEFERLKAKLGR